MFHSRVIRRSALPRFIELGDPRRDTNVAVVKKQKHLSLSCAVETQPYYSRTPTR